MYHSAMEGKEDFLSLCCRDGGFSSTFSENDATWRTDSSSALDDDEAEGDVYEMALEVLEGDEAYRLESSGSISPESDVDRLLENADAERFPGDVTLVRVFSIQRDVEGVFSSGSGETADLGGGLVSTENGDCGDSEPDFRRLSYLDKASLTDEMLPSDMELYIGETESEASVGKIRSPSAVARRIQRAFDSADLTSVELNSNSSSTIGLDEDLAGPRRTSAAPRNPDNYFADPGLVFGAKFSNVTSKDALIKTSLTVTSVSSREQDDQESNRLESDDVSLHLTSSDSLYSTDDCFCDSSFPDATTEPHFAAGRPFPEVSFSLREPSPEELFDLALETRSDLAGSSVGSSSFYDAVQCSPSTCIHRDPSPEEAFDLALETLSDIIDDDSSSVFVITPRPSAGLKRNDIRPDLPRPTIVCSRTAYDVESARSKMGDVVVNAGDSCCDLCGRRRCYAGGGGRGFCCGGRSSSCEAIVDDDQLMRTIGGSSSIDLLTDFSDWEASCFGRLPPPPRRRLQEELRWASDPCPSSPEPSTLADYSTDDCVGGESEEEEDSSMTDGDGLDPSSSLRNNFFLQRLLRRRQMDLPMTNGWTDRKTTEEDRLLDQVQICSIEDLMTDSDLERDSWNLKAQAAAGLDLQLHDNSPIFSFFRANGIEGRMDRTADDPSVQTLGPVAQVVGPIQPLSPPIAQSVRTEVHYARKSKIPKLPESRTTLSPVRISW